MPKQPYSQLTTIPACWSATPTPTPPDLTLESQPPHPTPPMPDGHTPPPHPNTEQTHIHTDTAGQVLFKYGIWWGGGYKDQKPKRPQKGV